MYQYLAMLLCHQVVTLEVNLFHLEMAQMLNTVETDRTSCGTVGGAQSNICSNTSYIQAFK